jgi:hypothetical protein
MQEQDQASFIQLGTAAARQIGPEAVRNGNRSDAEVIAQLGIRRLQRTGGDGLGCHGRQASTSLDPPAGCGASLPMTRQVAA